MRLLFFIALQGAVSLAAGPAAQALDLPSYEASYEVRLVHASGGAGPRAVTGTFDSRFAETCDGWDTKSHILLDLTFRDASTFTNERFFSSWEAKNGRDYRFAVQTVKNGDTVEAFQGTAKLNKNGGEAIYQASGGDGKKTTITLPRMTMLPVAQARALLEHAAQGDGMFQTVVLNGASSNGPRVMSTIIGPRVTQHTAPSGANIESTLLTPPAWRMSSALFNLNEKRDTPNTEIMEELHQSGVIQSFEQTFGDFTVSARLVKLRRMETPACG